MSWVRFTDDFDWKPQLSVTIAYQAGMTQYVTRRCAERAIAAGKAEKATDPAKTSPTKETPADANKKT